MKLMLALTAAAMLSAPLLAAPCRDAKGHFTKCPPAGAMPGGTASKGGTASAMPSGVTKDSKGKCHGSKGQFVACPK